MPVFLCRTCGVQHPERDTPPERCVICEDDRQWVPAEGQLWTTREALEAGYANAFKRIAPGLTSIETKPRFAIGQRAFLVATPHGNVLWDCISLLDEATRDIVAALGGLAAVAVSHPHFYSATAAWGRAFDCPVFLHEADREWVQEHDPHIEHWSGTTHQLLPGVTIHNFGGHFPGSSVLHLEEARTILTGDTVLVVFDRRHVSFMWSYPNLAPLPAAEVERLSARFDALDFDTIRCAFTERGDIVGEAKEAIARSARRHIDGPTSRFN